MTIMPSRRTSRDFRAQFEIPENFDVGVGRAASATFRQDFSTDLLFRQARIERASREGDPIAVETLVERNADLGLTAEQFGNRPRTQGEVDEIREGVIKQRALDAVRSLGPQSVAMLPVDLAAGIAGSLADPIDLASAFVPIVGSAGRASLAARLGGGIVGKRRARIAAGAIEGGVGTALTEPIYYGLSQQQALEYSMNDALFTIGVGTLLGGGIGGIVNVARTRPERRLRAVENSVAEAEAIARGERTVDQGDLSRMPEQERRQLAFRLAIAQAAEGREIDVGSIADISDLEITAIRDSRAAFERDAIVGGLSRQEAGQFATLMTNAQFGMLQNYGLTPRDVRAILPDAGRIQRAVDTGAAGAAISRGAEVVVSVEGQSVNRNRVDAEQGREGVLRELGRAGPAEVRAAAARLTGDGAPRGVDLARLQDVRNQTRPRSGSIEGSAWFKRLSRGEAVEGVRIEKAGRQWRVVGADGAELAPPTSKKRATAIAFRAAGGEDEADVRSADLGALYRDDAPGLRARLSDLTNAELRALIKARGVAMTGAGSAKKADLVNAIFRAAGDGTIEAPPPPRAGADPVEVAVAALQDADLTPEQLAVVLDILKRFGADVIKSAVQRALGGRKPKTVKEALDRAAARKREPRPGSGVTATESVPGHVIAFTEDVIAQTGLPIRVRVISEADGIPGDVAAVMRGGDPEPPPRRREPAAKPADDVELPQDRTTTDGPGVLFSAARDADAFRALSEIGRDYFLRARRSDLDEGDFRELSAELFSDKRLTAAEEKQIVAAIARVPARRVSNRIKRSEALQRWYAARGWEKARMHQLSAGPTAVSATPSGAAQAMMVRVGEGDFAIVLPEGAPGRAVGAAPARADASPVDLDALAKASAKEVQRAARAMLGYSPRTKAAALEAIRIETNRRRNAAASLEGIRQNRESAAPNAVPFSRQPRVRQLELVGEEIGHILIEHVYRSADAATQRTLQKAWRAASIETTGDALARAYPMRLGRQIAQFFTGDDVRFDAQRDGNSYRPRFEDERGQRVAMSEARRRPTRAAATAEARAFYAERIPDPASAYDRSFDEWLAKNISRTLTTTEAAPRALEAAAQGRLARWWRRLAEAWRGLARALRGQGYTDAAVDGWLASLGIDTAPAHGPDGGPAAVRPETGGGPARGLEDFADRVAERFDATELLGAVRTLAANPENRSAIRQASYWFKRLDGDEQRAVLDMIAARDAADPHAAFLEFVQRGVDAARGIEPLETRLRFQSDTSARDAERVLLEIASGGAENPRGMFDARSGMITLLERADASTMFHEMGHLHLDTLGRLAEAADADPRLVADMETAYRWMSEQTGVEARSWRDLTTEHHEAFARGFEAFLYEGGPANAGPMRGAFDAFRAMLRSVYKAASKLGVKLSPEIREVFGRISRPDDVATVTRQIEAAKIDPIATRAAEAKATTDDAADAGGEIAELDAQTERLAAAMPARETLPDEIRAELDEADQLTAYAEELSAAARAADEAAPEVEPSGRVVIGPDGSRVIVVDEVVDVEDIVTATGDLQPRDRTEATSEAWVADTAAKLDPDRLMPSREADRGSPIVDARGVVVSGNGRAMAIRRAFDEHPNRAAAYRAAIEAEGFSTEGVARPVLISRVASEDVDLVNFAREANAPAAAPLSRSEQAAIDEAAILAALPRFVADQDVNARANAGFRAAFLGELPAVQRGVMQAPGSDFLSDIGVARIKAATMRVAFGDSPAIRRSFESNTADSRAITNAMAATAARWIELRSAIERGDVSPEGDVRPFIVEALDAVRRARAMAESENITMPAALEVVADTAGLFAETSLSPVAREIMKAFFRPQWGRQYSAESIADFLSRLAREADSTQRAGLFDDRSSLLEVVQAAAAPEGEGLRLQSAFVPRAGDPAPDVAARDASAALLDQAMTAAAIARRNAALNAVRFDRLRQVIQNADAATGDPSLGLYAALKGVNSPFEGARQHADGRADAAAMSAQSALLTELKASGALPDLRRGRMDEAIVRELDNIQSANPQPGAVTGDARARAVAEIVERHLEAGRRRLNAAGGWTRKLERRILAQSHNETEMARMGEQAWMDFVRPLLDVGRMQTVSDEFLRSTYWALRTGVRKSGASPDVREAFEGPGNAARKLAEHRKIIFRDADAWLTYQRRLGTGSLLDTIMRDVERTHRAVGLFETFGTNPEAMLATAKRWARETYRERGEKLTAKLGSRQLDHIMADLVGVTRASAEGAETIAKGFSVFRAVQSMAKLGGAVISSIVDPANASADMMVRGVGPLTALARGPVSTIDGIARARGLNSSEKRALADSVGVGVDTVLRHMAGRHEVASDHSQFANKMLSAFFRLTLLSQWTDAVKRGATMAFLHDFASAARTPFDQINADFKRLARSYGVGADEWAEIAQIGIREIDQREFVDPRLIFRAAEAAGDEAERMRLIRLGEMVQLFAFDRANFASPTPGAGERAIMQQGTQRGTALGEALRLVFQFKAFPITVLSKTLGAKVYSRGARTAREGLSDLSNVKDLAAFLAAGWALGLIAMQMKEIAKGREPREVDASAAFAAFLQSGGLGIYGDFLLGQSNRFGNSTLDTIAGPGIGAASEFVNLVQKMRMGQFEDPDDAPSWGEVIRFVKSNTPFANMFYTRAALDYLILFQLQEAASPGYLRRMERRMKKDNNQSPLEGRFGPFDIQRPSEAIPRGSTWRIGEGVRANAE